jgi:hypothetical protein
VRAAFVAVLVLAAEAGAHPLALREGEQAASVWLGLDGAAAAGAGYAVAAPGLPLLFLEAAWPAGAASVDDAGLRAGAELDVSVLRLRLAGTFARASTQGMRAAALGLEAGLFAGGALGRFTLGVDGSVGHVLAAHITPTAWYRAQVYEGARAGWYGDTATTVRALARVAARLGRVEIGVDAGFAWTGRFDALPGVTARLALAFVL